MFKSLFMMITLAMIPVSGFADPAGSVKNDGEIARVLTTINESEIDAAKIELKNGKNPEARSFAQTMINEHKHNMNETKAIAKANSLDPTDSELSKSLTTDGLSNNGDLKKADKAAFDLAYIKQQIQMHEGALAVIDSKLMPKVENPNLRVQLTKTREAVVTHLDHAKALQSKL